MLLFKTLSKYYEMREKEPKKVVAHPNCINDFVFSNCNTASNGINKNNKETCSSTKN